MRSEDRPWYWAASVLVVIHLAALAYSLPIGALVAGVSHAHIDALYHLYQVELGAELCRGGRLVGYDPWLSAGYAGGAAYNASTKLQAAVLCALGGHATATQVYGWLDFVFAAIVPLGPLLAARALRLRPAIGSLAALLLLVVWWATPLRWYHTAGMVSFVVLVPLAMVFAAWLARVVLAGSFAGAVGLGIFGAFGLLLHPLFAVAASILSCAVIVGLNGRRAFMLRSTSLLVVVVVIASLPNLPWVMATLGLPGVAGTAGQPYQRLVGIENIVLEMLGRAPTARGGSLFYLVLALSTVGCLACPRRETQRIALAFVAAVVAFLVYAFLGGRSELLATLQPNRFAPYAWAICTIPAAIGLGSLVEYAAGQGRARAAAKVVVGVAAVGIAFGLGAWARELLPGDHGRFGVPRPELRGPGPVVRDILEWLPAPHARARLLLEGSKQRVYDDAHIAGHLAKRAGVEVLGGPYPFMGPTSFLDGSLLGKRIEDLPTEAINRFLDLYNVNVVVCHSSPCRTAVGRLAGSTSAGRHAAVEVFHLDRAPNIAFVGAARVVGRRANGLEIEATSTGPMVLRYHWVPGLRTEPPTKVTRRDIAGAEHPFIEIDTPPKRFVIGLGDPGER